MDSLDLIQELAETFGVAGFEEDIRALLLRKLEGRVDRVEVDALGNILAYRRGKSRKRLLLDAHMDEVGLVVSHVDAHGFLRVVPVGGWDPRILPGTPVQLRPEPGRYLYGVIGTAPPHVLTPEDRKKPVDFPDLFVDIGVGSREEAEALGIVPGTPLVPYVPARRLGPDLLMAKALDDRLGCALILQLLDRLTEPTPYDLVLSFSVSEELGLRGARVLVAQTQPDVALAIEGTGAADIPGVPEEKCPSRFRRGPVITRLDKSIVVPHRMVQALARAAEEAGVPYQFKKPIFGGTNAGAIHLSGKGVLAGVVSVPARYIHSPVSVVYRPDFDHTLQLVETFVRRIDQYLEE